MIRLLAIVCILSVACGAQAQSVKKEKAGNAGDHSKPPGAAAQESTAPTAPGTPTRVDLSAVPSTPVNSSPVNAPAPNKELLQPSGQGPAVPYRTTQTGSTQPGNATSNQFNLGNKKATNTIYYDNNGKMTGSGTSIQLGGGK